MSKANDSYEQTVINALSPDKRLFAREIAEVTGLTIAHVFVALYTLRERGIVGLSSDTRAVVEDNATDHIYALR